MKKERILPSKFNKKNIPLGKLYISFIIYFIILLTLLIEFLDNTTRWNSTYYMIKATLDLKEPLIYIERNITNPLFKKIALSKADFLALKELERIFIIFLKPSIKLQAQLYITLPKSLLYIYKIFNKLEALNEEFIRESKKPNLVSYLLIYSIFINTNS